MSKRLKESEEFSPGSRVEVLLSGVKKLRGKIAWSIMSEIPGHAGDTVLRIDYDLGGWFIFVVNHEGKNVTSIEASISVITNEGAQLELL